MLGCDADSADVLTCLRALPPGKILGNILGDSPAPQNLTQFSQMMHEAHAMATAGAYWNYKPKLFPLMCWYVDNNNWKHKHTESNLCFT